MTLSRLATFGRVLSGILVISSALACHGPGGELESSRYAKVQGDPEDTVHSLARKVATVAGFYGPEAARYDPEQDAWFVSNMLGAGSTHDGQGYIVRLQGSSVGTATMWARSGRNGVQLDAPKGIAFQGDTLWTADIDVVRGFNKRTGEPVGTIDFRPYGAVLLNDLAVGPGDTIYVTDTGIQMTDLGVLHPGGDKIFVVAPGRKVSVLTEGNQLMRPNGVVWDPASKQWVVVGFDPFYSPLYVPGKNADKPHELAHGKGRFDGVQTLGDGRFLVSGWSDSALMVIGNGESVRLVSGLTSPAAIGVDMKRHLVAIPEGIMGRVSFWELPPGYRGGDASRTVAAGRR
ncbi:MAG: SMP-30/gluconolactonase/LRE family protein [Gemmatimonadaceae bacterium]